VMWHRAFIILVTFIYTSLREQAQHRYVIGTFVTSPYDDKKYYTMEKRTFFDFRWLGTRQVWEIGQWVIGSAVVAVLWIFIA
jgi:hypothetical protein